MISLSRELEALFKLKDKSIVKLYQAADSSMRVSTGTPPSAVHLVVNAIVVMPTVELRSAIMEYCDQGDLRRLLKERESRFQGHPFSVAEASDIFSQIGWDCSSLLSLFLCCFRCALVWLRDVLTVVTWPTSAPGLREMKDIGLVHR